MRSRRRDTPLVHVQRLIKKLAPEERGSLIEFLAQFPDSGIREYDLRDELETLKKFGRSSIGPNDNPNDFMFELVFVRNLVSVRISGIEVLRTVFFPESFRDAFMQSPFTVRKFADHLFEELSKEETKAGVRDARQKEGIEESEEELNAVLMVFATKVADERMKVKAERVAEQITLHLPGMVGDMFEAAYKAQNWVDTQNLAKASGAIEKHLSNETFKKLILRSYWQNVKPHLNLDRNTRTKPEWRNDETLKQYARLVSDRKSLTTRIKDVYEDCDFEAGWINDLKEDSTFQRLSVGVSDDVLEFAMKRVADDGLEPREREALSIACEMARRELSLPEQDIETIRGYYGEGGRLIKKDRSHRDK